MTLAFSLKQGHLLFVFVLGCHFLQMSCLFQTVFQMCWDTLLSLPLTPSWTSRVLMDRRCLDLQAVSRGALGCLDFPCVSTPSTELGFEKQALWPQHAGHSSLFLGHGWQRSQPTGRESWMMSTVWGRENNLGGMGSAPCFSKTRNLLLGAWLPRAVRWWAVVKSTWWGGIMGDGPAFLALVKWPLANHFLFWALAFLWIKQEMKRAGSKQLGREDGKGRRNPTQAGVVQVWTEFLGLAECSWKAEMSIAENDYTDTLGRFWRWAERFKQDLGERSRKYHLLERKLAKPNQINHQDPAPSLSGCILYSGHLVCITQSESKSQVGLITYPSKITDVAQGQKWMEPSHFKAILWWILPVEITKKKPVLTVKHEITRKIYLSRSHSSVRKFLVATFRI